MSQIKELLKPSNYGLLEFLLCFQELLQPYHHLDYPVLLLVVLLSLKRKRKPLNMNLTWIKIMMAYVIIHDVLLCLVISPVPSYHFSNIVFRIFYFVAIFIVAPAVDFKKFVTSYSLITIFVLGGLLYHVLIIQMGGIVEPIKIPFLPYDGNATRLDEEGLRPVSFFCEPSNLFTYLILPLFLSLHYHKYKITAVLIFAVLLTTSTNGLMVALIMFLTFVFTQNIGKKMTFFLVIIGVAAGFAFVSLDIFNSSKEKIETTDVETTSRLINGPNLVFGMPKDHLIFGYPAASVKDYKEKTPYISHVVLLEKYDNYFVSSFWLTIAQYGIVGLLIYLFAYYKFYRIDKSMIVILLPLFILKFSAGALFNYGLFIMTTYMLIVMLHDRDLKRQEILKSSEKHRICIN